MQGQGTHRRIPPADEPQDAWVSFNRGEIGNGCSVNRGEAGGGEPPPPGRVFCRVGTPLEVGSFPSLKIFGPKFDPQTWSPPPPGGWGWVGQDPLPLLQTSKPLLQTEASVSLALSPSPRGVPQPQPCPHGHSPHGHAGGPRVPGHHLPVRTVPLRPGPRGTGPGSRCGMRGPPSGRVLGSSSSPAGGSMQRGCYGVRTSPS